MDGRSDALGHRSIVVTVLSRPRGRACEVPRPNADLPRQHPDGRRPLQWCHIVCLALRVADQRDEHPVDRGDSLCVYKGRARACRLGRRSGREG